jgi:hypothetical protein
MKSPASFVISEFTNPSGEVVFRVSGQLDGKRIRKNFATRTEAQAERQTLEIARIKAEFGVRTAATPSGPKLKRSRRVSVIVIEHPAETQTPSDFSIRGSHLYYCLNNSTIESQMVSIPVIILEILGDHGPQMFLFDHCLPLAVCPAREDHHEEISASGILINTCIALTPPPAISTSVRIF